MTELPKNVQKWTKALRSGKYKQGQGSLRSKDGFCCLGVVADICPYIEWADPQKEYGPYLALGNKGREQGHLSLPTCAKEWVGLKTNFGGFSLRVAPYETCKDLSDLNDEKKLSFYEIADFIESHWDILKGD